VSYHRIEPHSRHRKNSRDGRSWAAALVGFYSYGLSGNREILPDEQVLSGMG